jgi:hypothetical protein
MAVYALAILFRVGASYSSTRMTALEPCFLLRASQTLLRPFLDGRFYPSGQDFSTSLFSLTNRKIIVRMTDFQQLFTSMFGILENEGPRHCLQSSCVLPGQTQDFQGRDSLSEIFSMPRNFIQNLRRRISGHGFFG